MVQRTYVPGPNIARGAECDADVLMLRQSLSSVSQQQHSRSRASVSSTEKPFGGPWVPSRQDHSSPLITVNAALAPQWTTALDIGRQVLSGNPFPGSPTGRVELVGHSPTPPAAGGSGPPRYQPPVQLVVLPGALQRLGPSTPWRYTAGRLTTLDLQAQQPPLSPGPTDQQQQQQQGWAFDAATQTMPPELARDWEAMHRGSPALAARDCAAAAVRPHSGVAAQRPSTAPPAAAGAAAACRAGRQPGGVRALECNPWQLTFKQEQQQQEHQREPWVQSYRAAADWTIAAAASAAGQVGGGRRRSQPDTPADSAAAAALAATKAAAAARRSAAVRFAALGRRAAMVRAEGLAAAATVAGDRHNGSSDAGSCCCCGGNTVVCVVDVPSAAAAAHVRGSHCSCCSCSPEVEASGVADSLSICSAASSSSSSGGGGGSVYLPCCDEVGIQDLAALLAEV